MNHLSANVAQKLKSFVRWKTHEDRPYELHDNFLATLTRERYLKFRHMDTLSFSTSSPSHHEPSKLKTSFSGESKHQTPSESQTALNSFKKGMTEFRQPIQVQSHLEMPGILVQLGHIHRT